jgi:hypothetical protein
VDEADDGWREATLFATEQKDSLRGRTLRSKGAAAQPVSAAR